MELWIRSHIGMFCNVSKVSIISKVLGFNVTKSLLLIECWDLM